MDISTKPWWQSKIVLVSVAAILLFGGGLLYQFLGNQGVTQTQLDVLTQQYPDIKEGVQNLQNSDTLWKGLGLLVGALAAIFRVWFTTKPISSQSA